MLFPEKNNSVAFGAPVPQVDTRHTLASGGSSEPAALQHPDQYLDLRPPMTTSYGHFWQMPLTVLSVSIRGEFSPRGPEVLIWPLLAAPNLPPSPPTAPDMPLCGWNPNVDRVSVTTHGRSSTQWVSAWREMLRDMSLVQILGCTLGVWVFCLLACFVVVVYSLILLWDLRCGGSREPQSSFCVITTKSAYDLPLIYFSPLFPYLE